MNKRLTAYNNGGYDRLEFNYLDLDIVVTRCTMQLGNIIKTHTEWKTVTDDDVWEDWSVDNGTVEGWVWRNNKGWLLELCGKHIHNLELIKRSILDHG